MDERTSRYQVALQAYQKARGVEPDQSWQVILKLIAAIPELWHKVEPHPDNKTDETGLWDLSNLNDLLDNLLRIAATAKTWGVPPSIYFPELGPWERCCFDEACAYVLSVKQREAGDQAREGE